MSHDHTERELTRTSYAAAQEEDARNNRHRQRPRAHQPPSIIEGNGERIHEQPLDQDAFSERVVTAALDSLVILLPDKHKRHIGNCEVNLATLQRMNIHAIQRDLVRLTARISSTGRMEVHPRDDATHSQAVEVRELMKEYLPKNDFKLGTAWRDWDMILKSASTVGHDPFRITTHMEFSSKLMEESGLLTREAIHNIQAAANPGGPRLPLLLLETLDRRSEERLPGVPRHATLRDGMIKEATQRFLWGLGGGLALICPMVLMVLHKDTLTTLLTTSVSVILFSFAVASISSGLLPGTEAIDLGPRDVLAATATYAAVLVVFVGASS